MSKFRMMLAILLSLTTNLLVAQTYQSLQVSNVLQSNMVLQQKKDFKIWGKAAANAEITVKADWAPASVTTKADAAGNFLTAVKVPAALKGNFDEHSLSIKSLNDEVKLDHLLIGDVWFCSGQSNMQFAMKEEKNAAIEIPAANYPNIRLFNADLNFSATPILNVKGKWQACSPETVKNFSAVGYSFGKNLQKQLDIPLGLIFSGIGASKVEAFVPQEALKQNPILDSVYLQPYLNNKKSKEVINGGFSFEKVTRPFLLYNAMIHPFTNLSIKGFLWYQGEGNRMERDSYTLATQTLISTWRENFNQGQLPFYYVQVAPFFYDKEDPTLNDYAFFREAQEKISTMKNTAMVVSMDVGEAKDLHPKSKMPLGLRLAKTALHLTYGQRNVNYLGPKFKRIKIKGDELTVSFESASVKSGLGTNDGKSPMFFALAGADQVFYPAKAEIAGKKIILSSREVKAPLAVRYAFTNYPVTNLQNNDGLPAIPFRSDNWAEK